MIHTPSYIFKFGRIEIRWWTWKDKDFHFVKTGLYRGFNFGPLEVLWYKGYKGYKGDKP